MTIQFGLANTDNSFIEEVERLSKQDILACYQCGRCSAGCPMAPYMDILPNQMMRLVQLGAGDRLLNSRAIWDCVSCMTCNSRCPKGINIAEVIEAMRQINLRQRKDHVDLAQIPKPGDDNLPPIALICNMRKFTS